MKNADLPAMPLSNEDQVEAISSGQLLAKQFSGLSKREMFVMAVIQGLSSSASDYSRFYEMATDAVAIADAVLLELERTK